MRNISFRTLEILKFQFCQVKLYPFPTTFCPDAGYLVIVPQEMRSYISI